MLAAYDQAPGERRFGRRATALAIVIAVHVLLGLLLYFIAPQLRPPLLPQAPIVLTMLPPSPSPAPEPTASPKAKAAKPSSSRPRKPTPKPVTPKRKPPAAFDLPIIVVSKADLAQGDISKIPSITTEQSASLDTGIGKGEGRSGDSDFVEGGAPGGGRLYKAEWYREPTPAEINGYMTQATPEGAWGEIACKIIPRYHVEDCQEVAEAPRGSGISRSLRQAAWQFRVRPPRLDGKELFGVWVSIRIDFTRNAPG